MRENEGEIKDSKVRGILNDKELLADIFSALNFMN